MKHWTVDDLPWDSFQPEKLDPDMLKVIRAAALVEFNGGDYLKYLSKVFRDDPDFCAVAEEWAQEEIQHGEALGRYARLADPAFDFDGAFRRFLEGFRVDLDADESIRGSRYGELLSRCVVETGTSTFYAALHDATEEPLLRAICRNIAADELRHYKTFYAHMKRYRERDRIGPVTRMRVALGRVWETQDDELPYAYHCANGDGGSYDRRRTAREFARLAYGNYQYRHVDRAVAMIFKVIGLKANGRHQRLWASMAYRMLRQRSGGRDLSEQRAAA